MADHFSPAPTQPGLRAWADRHFDCEYEALTKRFLITTADERTWPHDQPVLFLGEWCRLYNRRAAWQDLDAEVVPYHWDDREKLHRDYQYLYILYEELLQELAEQLNALHGVEHSLRYWRILVGPWLGYFVQMLFDRWTMIERAVRDHSIVGVQVLETPPEQVIPNDFDHFVSLFLADPWNEAIYSQLLRGWSTVPVEVVPIERVRRAEHRLPVLPVARRLKRTLGRAASLVSQLLTREDDAFFISAYLPIRENLRLQWRLGQVPKIWRSHPTPKAEVDWTKRQWRMNESEVAAFPAIVRAIIPRHIPATYLEGYGALQVRSATLPWPRKPRLIFTSNAYSSDEVFKAWTAAKVEAGAPLVIGQHGGNYGTGRWESTEDHQIAISDAWLSWGWDDEGNPRIKPVGNLKMVGHHLGWDPAGHALMVEAIVPRYSYRMFSVPVASQWLGYFDDQCRFVAALPQRLREALLVRLHHQDYGWCPMQRWQDRFPQIRLDDGSAPIASLIEKSRLYISTYNATTFLESLAMNIPTLMFWNPNHWELRDSAIPYFERLKSVGIFHETPEPAAAKVAEVWDDVAGWWHQPEIQAARQYFCQRFSRTVDKPIQVLKEALEKVVSSNANDIARSGSPQ